MCSLSCEIKANVTLAFLEGKKRSNKDVASESRRLLADTFITKPLFFFCYSRFRQSCVSWLCVFEALLSPSHFCHFHRIKKQQAPFPSSAS